MSNLIGIVNYGISGNIYSINQAVEAAGGIPVLINTVTQFENVDKIILPGVGSFKDAMQALEKYGFLDSIKNTNKPILGICLGMQILATLGFEYGTTKGLSIIEAEVKPMLVNSKVPHVGFNAIEVINSNEILKGLEFEEFYFMHSYEVVNYKNISSLTEYSGHKFVSSVHKNNIYGVQFHPEKSRDAGIMLFRNFIHLQGEG